MSAGVRTAQNHEGIEPLTAGQIQDAAETPPFSGPNPKPRTDLEYGALLILGAWLRCVSCRVLRAFLRVCGGELGKVVSCVRLPVRRSAPVDWRPALR